MKMINKYVTIPLAVLIITVLTAMGLMAAAVRSITGIAEYDGSGWDRARHSFTQATTGITANAAGVAVAMGTTPMSKYTLVVDRTIGATDVVEVDMQCSIDGVIFVQIATITNLAIEPVLTSHDGTPCTDFRYNVVTVGAGNTLTVQLIAVR